MTILALQRDNSGQNTYGRVQSDVIFGGLLEQDTVDSFVVPNEFARYELIFSYQPGLDVWVSTTNTAAYPASTTAAVTSESLPTVLVVAGGTTISLITPETSARYSCSVYGVS